MENTNIEGTRGAKVGGMKAVPLPPGLGEVFDVRSALAAGVHPERLRRKDLETPIRGVRRRGDATALASDIDPATADDPFARQAAEHRAQALAFAPRLRPLQFFSHDTAVHLRGGPLPLATDAFGRPLDGALLPLHVSTMGTGPLMRSHGVSAHRADPRTSQVTMVAGVPTAAAGTAWASLGSLDVPHLVALGDHFCRRWRTGVGRRHVGRPPLATLDELRTAIASGRRVGVRRLREAVELVREDSWSPRESRVRCILVMAGLPEPELNVDIRDEHGFFLACVDMVYPAERVIIEYHGSIHSSRYAKDVERIAALRAAGWTVIEVTAPLLRTPGVLVSRVRAALFAR